jgi:hypothetical protein
MPTCRSVQRAREAWLAKQVLPDDERAAIARHLRELDRLGEDLVGLDRDIGEAVVDQPDVKRLLTIAGVNVTVAAGLVAQKLRSLELQAGRPMRKGNKRGPAYAYNVKELRDREKALAEQAERAYEQLIAGWRDRPGRRRMGAARAAS